MKTKPRIRTPFDTEEYQGQKILGLSRTTPYTGLSLSELVSRHKRGLPIEMTAQTPIYDDDDVTYGVNPKTLDLADIEQLKLNNAEKIIQLKQKQKDEAKEAQKQRQDAENQRLAKEEEKLQELIRKNKEKL